MLGGMAMKFAWRKRAEKLGLDIQAKKPNLVISLVTKFVGKNSVYIGMWN